MPASASGSIGFCGTVRTMTGTPSSASWIISTSLEPLIRPWSSASTRTMSGRSSLIVGDRPAAVGQDLEELDPLLRVEQAADVLRDLRDVLDDEQARLVTLWHRAGRYHEGRGWHPAGGPPPDGPDRTGLGRRSRSSGHGLTARRIARSLPGPSGPMS